MAYCLRRKGRIGIIGMASEARKCGGLKIGLHGAIGQCAGADGDARRGIQGITIQIINCPIGWRPAVGPGSADKVIIFPDVVAWDLVDA